MHYQIILSLRMVCFRVAFTLKVSMDHLAGDVIPRDDPNLVLPTRPQVVDHDT